MENRGLCQTCVNDKTCIFSRKPTILQCEEFDHRQPAAISNRKNSSASKKAK
ncbi:MAG: hypothetical protein WC417_01605 [Candidatus Omnitrophota bacterium]|jgi:hypothetical protein